MFQGKQRLFAVILLVSLALNLFLGGIMLGKYFSFPPPPPPHPPHMRLNWMIQALPEESQAKIRPLMEDFHTQKFSQMRRMRKARQAVHTQLTATDFDKQALSQALSDLRQEMANTQQQMHHQLVEIASQLDEKERQQLSKAVHRKPPKRHGRGKPPFHRNEPPFLEGKEANP